MNENMELALHVYQDADMAVDNLTKILTDLKEKDNKIKSVIEELISEYEKYLNESECILKENVSEVKEKGIISKISSEVGIKMEINKDNSDARVADMLIKGLSMGVIDMEKKINAYEEICEHDEIKLAKKFLNFQNDYIEKLKKFL